MADDTYQNSKVYLKQGGDELVVASGGKITVEPGGIIAPAAGAAAAIANLDLTTTYADDAAATEAAINGILAALRSAGIIATA